MQLNIKKIGIRRFMYIGFDRFFFLD